MFQVKEQDKSSEKELNENRDKEPPREKVQLNGHKDTLNSGEDWRNIVKS